jgi:hypothetical protein
MQSSGIKVSSDDGLTALPAGLAVSSSEHCVISATSEILRGIISFETNMEDGMNMKFSEGWDG